MWWLSCMMFRNVDVSPKNPGISGKFTLGVPILDPILAWYWSVGAGAWLLGGVCCSPLARAQWRQWSREVLLAMFQVP